MKPLLKTALFMYGISLAMPVFAGNEFYLGIDSVHHSLDTSTTTWYSSVNPTSYGTAEETYHDLGLRAGYKYKSRLTDRYFWCPELSVTALDDEFLYGTNLRLGYEFSQVETYAVIGVSRIDKFTDNRLNYGLGLEYRVTNNTSFNIQYDVYDPIVESTESTVTIGMTTIDVRTYTERRIETLKLGFTYYFQGSK
ncbi:MAG: hypothetical protein AB1744_00325 [Candidatus Zixiibacteriota bacterium]